MATVNDLVMVEAPATVRSLVAADAFARENLLGPVATEAELTDDVRRLLDAIFGEVVEVGAPAARSFCAIPTRCPWPPIW